jgi:hypothetical protein
MAIETDVTAKILIVQRRQVYATLGTEKGGGLLIEARLFGSNRRRRTRSEGCVFRQLCPGVLPYLR